jgi:hypothetical protein
MTFAFKNGTLLLYSYLFKYSIGVAHHPARDTDGDGNAKVVNLSTGMTRFAFFILGLTPNRLSLPTVPANRLCSLFKNHALNMMPDQHPPFPRVHHQP